VHVSLEALPPGTGPGAADRIDDLDQDRLDRTRFDLVVMRLDGVDDVGVLSVPAREVGADERVRPLVLMG